MKKKYSLIMIFVLTGIVLVGLVPVRIFINSNDNVTGVFITLYTSGQNYQFTEDLSVGLSDDIWRDIGDNEEPYALNVEGDSSSGYHYDHYEPTNFTWATDPIEHYNNFNDVFYSDFNLGPNVSIFIHTNSDVEECDIDLYDGLGFQTDTETTLLDNNDYDNDGWNEIQFNHVYLESSPQSMYVMFEATNVYDEEMDINTYPYEFVYNSGTGRWEYFINLTYSLPSGEERILNKGWNWESCPRLFRDGNDGFDIEIVIDDLEPYALWVEAQVPLENYMQFYDDPPYWYHNNEFDEFTSSSGYKINMNSDYSSYDLDMYGTRLDPNTTVLLNGGGVENWIGYYPEVSQKPSVAFAQIWDDNLYQIKAEDWTMYKHNGQWQGSNMRYTLNYGEMYIIKLEHECQDFQWNYTGGVDPGNRDKAEHFTYEEEADYIPIFVEFEEGEEPLEIGVKVDGECKGASKVEDSSVQINAYILEGDGEDVEFEMFYGRSKPETTCKDYLVYDPVSDLIEKRKIRAGEYRDFYMVSFNEEEEDQIDNETLQVNHSPNPFYTSTVISYNLSEDKNISLEVYNIKGQRIKTLYNGTASKGDHSITWNGTDANNHNVSSGIYFYKLISPGKVISKKMLMMR